MSPLHERIVDEHDALSKELVVARVEVDANPSLYSLAYTAYSLNNLQHEDFHVETIPASTTDMLIETMREETLTIDVTSVVAYFIVSDQPLLIETVHPTDPSETLELKPFEHLYWDKASPARQPFQSGISAIYVTNETTETANIIFQWLWDKKVAPNGNGIVLFGDAHIERTVRIILEAPTAPLSYTDASRITSLQVTDRNVSDMSGIERLSGLIHLDLSNNNIADVLSWSLFPDSLRTLNLTGNPLGKGACQELKMANSFGLVVYEGGACDQY